MSVVGAEAAVQPAAAPVQRPARRGLPLATRFAFAFLGLVSAVLAINGAIDMWLSWRDATSTAFRVQQEKAEAAASRVAQFVSEIEGQMGWTTRAEWARLPVDQRRYDFIRLLRQAPAITELIQVDGQGREQLKLSRLEPDAVGSNLDLSADPRVVGALRDRIWYGPVTFRRGSEPYMAIGIGHVGRNAGATIAEVNLKLVWDVVTAIRVGEAGYAFVTDLRGRLIAHPDMSLVLRDTDLSRLPQVAAAIAAPGQATGGKGVIEGVGPDGRAELSAFAAVPRLGWLVFVELPRHEAFAAVWKALYQTLALLALGIGLAAVAGTLLARRLSAPIRELRVGAEQLGRGDLARRIPVARADEIGALATSFNVMAERIQEAQATLERRVEERTRDLNEALEYQMATSEVLGVISRSPGVTAPVLDAIAETALDLCAAVDATVLLRGEDHLRLGAYRGALKFDTERLPLSRDYVAGRAVIDAMPVQIEDLLAVGDEFRLGLHLARQMGFRTAMAVPLMREEVAIGCILVRRDRVAPFAPRQIALLQTFADQAVIAIDNANLFEQVQARTRELQQSLDDLRAAQDRLIQSEKLASLGQLTAGIAHEIKNPLNFVNNFADLSRELVSELEEIVAKSADEAIKAEAGEIAGLLRSNLEKVVTHGKRADSIVRNMLAHSRKGGDERRTVDLNATVEEALNLAYHGARAEKPGFNVTLERDLDPAAGLVELYPQEFTRVLLNLIGNGFHAVDQKRRDGASPGFEPTLTVRTRSLGDRIEVLVRDNGTGMPEHVKAHIFEPFFTTKPTGEGTGLGLSLSHDIVVKQHGGEIAVETSPGAFTAFTVTLPRGTVGRGEGA